MEHIALSRQEVVWALGSLCALERLPFDGTLLTQQLPPPCNLSQLIHTGRALGFRIDVRSVDSTAIPTLHLPCLALVYPEIDDGGARSADPSTPASAEPPPAARVVLILKADRQRVLMAEPGNVTPTVIPLEDFSTRYCGTVLPFAPAAERIADNDPGSVTAQPLGFRWFIPELLKHRAVWRDVLLASLALQLIGLATPLFTQTIIDKVVVHESYSTLTVIGIGLLVFTVFSALMSWVRQYLVLHTGNRVDAVLGTQVFAHLVKLPLRYFQQRATGLIVARLQGIETIREFIASAAVNLVLDLPFLFIFLGIMCYYSVPLSLISVALLGIIVGLSALVAPHLRNRLNEQFLVGARNQSFLTEYVAGIESVKSLQLEPQLIARYGDYLARYLETGFRTKQLGNTYGTLANTLDQLMTIAILWMGARLVMSHGEFTIGMLVAFQMFAGKLSQPLLRLVGLWQQFQQAHIAVQRLGDVLDAPMEPYALTPTREGSGRGRIEFRAVAFRYADHLPYLYRDFHFTLQPGRCVALLGPSGSGKSTLAKLLQGFYCPDDGQILLDGRDTRYLSANELRATFGVVPQDTTLFSGTLYDNLLLANPQATFDDIIHACKLAEIHTTIEQLPEAYQTKIGERGVGLSGGQKQRIAIARALLKRPKVLLFDEATSSLDPLTAEHLAKTINTLKGNASVLFIAHQLPKVLRVDEIVHLSPTATQGSAIKVVRGEG